LLQADPLSLDTRKQALAAEFVRHAFDASVVTDRSRWGDPVHPFHDREIDNRLGQNENAVVNVAVLHATARENI
jgi:hypothetical protein